MRKGGRPQLRVVPSENPDYLENTQYKQYTTRFDGERENVVLEDGGAALLPSKLSPESLLSQYFRDVSGLPVLRPAEEFDMARTIEKQEQVLWAQLLSHPRLMEPLLAKIERQLDIDSSKLSLARRTAREYRRYRRAASKKRFERATERRPRVIRAKGVDR